MGLVSRTSIKCRLDFLQVSGFNPEYARIPELMAKETPSTRTELMSNEEMPYLYIMA